MTPYKGIKTSDELAFLMHKSMEADAANQATGADKVSEAIDCMVKAAEILEGLQDRYSAEAITLILEKMAGKNV